MAMLVNFGNISTVNGRTVMSGMSSGINTKEIITALSEVKKIEINRIQDKIDINAKKTAAYAQLKEKLEILGDSVNSLRKIPSLDETGNSFNGRTIYMTSSDGTAPNLYMSVAAEKSAFVGTHSILVSNVAVAKSQMSAAFSSNTASVTEAASGTTAGMFSAGTFQINSTAITLAAGDSLVNIQAKINAVTSDTGVRAEIIKVSDTDYRINIESIETGVANAYTITDPLGVITQVSFPTTVAAADASFTFDGIPMTRSTNSISDVIANVDFILYQSTGGATVNLDISNDPTIARDAIKKFATAYNDFVQFASYHQQRDANGNFLDTSVLGKDSILRSIAPSVITQITSMVKGLSDDDYNSLYQIGISLMDQPPNGIMPEIKNMIYVDESKLDGYLASNFEDVRKIFEFNFTANSVAVRNYGRSNSINIYEGTLNINTANPSGTQVEFEYVDENGGSQSEYLEYSGTSTAGMITGPTGTVIEGLKIAYYGDGTDNIDISYSQGIADRLYNLLQSYTEDGGVIDDAVEAISNQDYRHSNEIFRRSMVLEGYIEKLIEKFARVEQSIANVNSILMLLDAQNKAGRGSD